MSKTHDTTGHVETTVTTCTKVTYSYTREDIAKLIMQDVRAREEAAGRILPMTESANSVTFADHTYFRGASFEYKYETTKLGEQGYVSPYLEHGEDIPS